MEENLRRLSNCLSQASQVVQELAANSGRNVVADATVGETSTSTNTSITTVGQAVSRARAMMRQSTTRGLYSRLNSRERLRASSSNNSAPVKSKRAKVESNKVFEFVLLRLDDEFIYLFIYLLFSHNKDYTSITLYKDVARGPQKTTRLVRGGPLVTIILSNRTITTQR